MSSDFPNCVFSTLSLPSTPIPNPDSTPSNVSVDTHSSPRVQKSKGHCTRCDATSCDSERLQQLQHQTTDDRLVGTDKLINEKGDLSQNAAGLCEKLDGTSIVGDSGTLRQHVANDGSQGGGNDSEESADGAKLKADQPTSQQVTFCL